MSRRDVDILWAESPSEAVNELLTQQEDQWFDRKSGRISARDLAVPMVAFANSEGGVIAVGFHGGKVDGVTDSRANELRQAAIDFTIPVVRHTVREFTTDAGERILIFQVQPGEQVHETSRGDCYLRIGDESRKLDYLSRRELEFDRGSAPFDGTRADASPVDLSTNETEQYRKAIGSKTIENALSARDLLTRDGKLTVAGWLLFAEHPQSLFPSAHVRVLKYMENVRGTGGNMTLADGGDVRFDGSIPNQISSAAEQIERWMPSAQVLTATGRFAPRPIIPKDVWLEGLVNAVLHRSYSIAGDHVRVEIFPNRVEIVNPGRFPGLADPSRPMEINRFARNPRIVRVCSDLGISRELGEGIKRIFTEMRSLGLTDPIYQQGPATVRLTLSSADALPEEVRRSLPKSAIVLLNVLRLENRPLSTGQAAELAGVARPTAVRALGLLRDAGLVTWDGLSSNDPRASWHLA